MHRQTLILLACAAAGFFATVAIGRRVGFVSFRVLLIVGYTFLYPISGVVHLLRSGHYDWPDYFKVMVELSPADTAYLVMVICVGLAAIVTGALINLPNKSRAPSRTAPLSPFDGGTIVLLVTVVLPVSILAGFTVRRVVSGLDLTGGRVVALPVGTARYGIISHWAVWAISLSIIWYALRTREKRSSLTVLALLVGVYGISSVVDWTGGRADAVLASMPLVLVLLPELRKKKSTFALLGLALTVGAVWRVVSLTSYRSSETSKASSLIDWLDWELGRFSMVGWATHHVDQVGLLNGETLANGGHKFLAGFQKLLGLPASDAPGRSAARFATDSLAPAKAGVYDYVNPSLIAEMYLNFGLLGVLSICLTLGVLSGYADGRFASSTTAITQLAWALVGTTVSVMSLFNEAASPLVYIVYHCTPLIFGAAISAYFANSKIKRAGRIG